MLSLFRINRDDIDQTYRTMKMVINIFTIACLFFPVAIIVMIITGDGHPAEGSSILQLYGVLIGFIVISLIQRVLMIAVLGWVVKRMKATLDVEESNLSQE